MAGAGLCIPALAATTGRLYWTLRYLQPKIRGHWTDGCRETLCAGSWLKSDPEALLRGLHKDRRTVRCVLIGLLDVTSESSHFEDDASSTRGHQSLPTLKSP